MGDDENVNQENGEGGSGFRATAVAVVLMLEAPGEPPDVEIQLAASNLRHRLDDEQYAGLMATIGANFLHYAKQVKGDEWLTRALKQIEDAQE